MANKKKVQKTVAFVLTVAVIVMSMFAIPEVTACGDDGSHSHDENENTMMSMCTLSAADLEQNGADGGFQGWLSAYIIPVLGVVLLIAAIVFVTLWCREIIKKGINERGRKK